MIHFHAGCTILSISEVQCGGWGADTGDFSPGGYFMIKSLKMDISQKYELHYNALFRKFLKNTTVKDSLFLLRILITWLVMDNFPLYPILHFWKYYPIIS